MTTLYLSCDDTLPLTGMPYTAHSFLYNKSSTANMTGTEY